MEELALGMQMGDGIDDLYYPRLDGTDILYIVDKHGNFKDQTNESNLFSPQMKSNGCKHVSKGELLGY